MPIEVKELVIKATVQEKGEGKSRGGGKMQEEQKEELIQECVDKVLRILNRQKER